MEIRLSDKELKTLEIQYRNDAHPHQFMLLERGLTKCIAEAQAAKACWAIVDWLREHGGILISIMAYQLEQHLISQGIERPASMNDKLKDGGLFG